MDRVWKYVLFVLLVAGVAIAGCAQEAVKEQVAGEDLTVKNISPVEAFELIQKNKGNPDFVILDVRTPEEFSQGHIENAINVNYYSKTFENELNRLDKNKTYLVYCRTGHRSGLAVEVMKELGFKKVYNMMGGIAEWEAKGLPVVR
ncbi:rhodanese-like domain-containing protein [Archaeoglobus veneficus]|uniref:Rhodanese-like protein n=1 Tax=Archaeoglobus veneficus (strain DSM 11195 / SNP6) TaxID=693661 RepID=F2KPE5_ARCVS|nr:rhodanese-like domain-containing protein [Archaeoglobus veneficus]AEA46376.1 Rhodanese-like protein [Archaeoglobus veneficus SNP6]